MVLKVDPFLEWPLWIFKSHKRLDYAKYYGWLDESTKTRVISKFFVKSLVPMTLFYYAYLIESSFWTTGIGAVLDLKDHRGTITKVHSRAVGNDFLNNGWVFQYPNHRRKKSQSQWISRLIDLHQSPLPMKNLTSNSNQHLPIAHHWVVCRASTPLY